TSLPFSLNSRHLSFIPFFNASFSATALFRRVFPNVLYNLHAAKVWPAHGTEMCGLRERQCLVVEFASGFGIGCGVGGMFVQNIWFFVFLHARRLIASNEDRQLPFRAEAAQCLQSRSRLSGGVVAIDSGGLDFSSRIQCAAMGDANCHSRSCDWVPDCAGVFMGVRDHAGRNCARIGGGG